MAWIAAVIGVVGGVVQTGMKNDAAKRAPGMPGGQAGSMDLGKMWFADSSMNNAGMIVTTNGSKANATATTDRTTSPSTSASVPSLVNMGQGGAGGLDLTTIGIGIAVFMLLRKK